MIGLVYIYIYIPSDPTPHGPSWTPWTKPQNPRRVAADQHHLHHGAQTVLVDDAGRLTNLVAVDQKWHRFFREKI